MDVAVDVKMTAILNVGTTIIKIIQTMVLAIQVAVNLAPVWMIVMYVQADVVIVVRMAVKETAEADVLVVVIAAQELVLVVQVHVLVDVQADVKLNVH